MARSADWCPNVPTEYRSIEVCDYIAYRWDTPEGIGWRMGIDQALEAIQEDLDDAIRAVEDLYPGIPLSDWAEGVMYGREDELDDFKVRLHKYSK